MRATSSAMFNDTLLPSVDVSGGTLGQVLAIWAEKACLSNRDTLTAI